MSVDVGEWGYGDDNASADVEDVVVFSVGEKEVCNGRYAIFEAWGAPVQRLCLGLLANEERWCRET